jgi:hypothetical protein
MPQKEHPQLAGNFSLSPRQERLLLALLQGSSIVDAAKAAGVSERTAHTYLALPTVQQAWRQGRMKAYDHAIARIQALCHHAVTTLAKNLLDNTAASAGNRAVQLRAAELILNYAQHASEVADLQQQIDELRAELDLDGVGGKNGRTAAALKRVK